MSGGAPEELANYIRSLAEFEIVTQIGGKYDHVGATLANAVLQANNNYERNVRPRIKRIRMEYADDTSLEDLKRLLSKIGAQKFLRWNGTRKPQTLLALVDLLWREGVNTEDDLRRWLQKADSRDKLLKIRFVGRKTADYLRILVGLDDEAVDRRLLDFLEQAGLGRPTYEHAKEILRQTADFLGINRAFLDNSIWRYMGQDRNGDACCTDDQE